MTASLFTRSRTIGSVSSRVRSIDFCTLRLHFLVLWLDGSPACLPQPAASKKGLRWQSVLRLDRNQLPPLRSTFRKSDTDTDSAWFLVPVPFVNIDGAPQ